ncbi:hypothetical protein GFS24_22900 [Chitinophaga sp. SYP-B3965]|uniref:hypothetical protein n=1 Tax=Chitinophaga sp. SYP-B3965 TaxID=2663120 RepID=UPI001299776C|nr:hypothetical protein [Chitinophaga sp. SYP-B3965]MRG47987.1 hypothetical protein [Chitinophaga sp. SYP-B3965]
MKKIITILAIMFTTGAAFASNDNVTDNKKAMVTFNQEFAGASDVAWYNSDEGTVAKFVLKNSKVTAHFNKAGELLATSRYITDADLPLGIINKLIKRFPEQNIRNVVEYSSEGESTYVISLENETEWTILKAKSGSPLITLKKLQKN